MWESANDGVNRAKSELEKNPETLPKNTSLFATGDPFLSKLQEIDCDIWKFNNILGWNLGLCNVEECDVGREGVPRAHVDVQDGQTQALSCPQDLL